MRSPTTTKHGKRSRCIVIHYTLNTGDTVHSARSKIHAEVLAALRPLHNGGPIPGVPSSRVTVTHRQGCVIFTIWRGESRSALRLWLGRKMARWKHGESLRICIFGSRKSTPNSRLQVQCPPCRERCRGSQWSYALPRLNSVVNTLTGLDDLSGVLRGWSWKTGRASKGEFGWS